MSNIDHTKLEDRMARNKELDKICRWLKGFEAALARLNSALLSLFRWADVEEFYLVNMPPAKAAQAYVRRVALYGVGE